MHACSSLLSVASGITTRNVHLLDTQQLTLLLRQYSRHAVMLGGGDPPRRPPQRNPLVRSKSCYGPTRRKRGREVLEDITWIVNHPSSWQQNDTAGPAHPSALAREDGSLGQTTEELEEAVDGGLVSHKNKQSMRAVAYVHTTCYSLHVTIRTPSCSMYQLELLLHPYAASQSTWHEHAPTLLFLRSTRIRAMQHEQDHKYARAIHSTLLEPALPG